MTDLPDGWDIERIRARAHGDVEVLSCNRRVVLDVHCEGARELTAACILSFRGLCLLRSVGDPEWYMGQLADDGSIFYWGSYGPELGEAIDGL
jgi:hypothetical protein